MRKLTIFVFVAALLVACQSTPKKATTPTPAATPAPAETPAPVAEKPAEPAAAPTLLADASTITAGATGFSPLAMAPRNYVSYSLHFGNPSLVKAWTLEFVDKDGLVSHQVKGTGPNLPPAITWDGTSDGGTPAIEGRYVARLTVDHGEATGPEVVQANSILLDRTPASGTITVSPQPFIPAAPGQPSTSSQVTITLNIQPGIASVATWRLFVTHPNGTQFMNFISEDHKDNVVVWNGRAVNNALLEGGTTYALSVQIFDEYGNVGTLKGALPVVAPVVVQAPQPAAQAAPVTVTLDGKLFAESMIYFPAYSSDFSKVDASRQATNTQALQALAQALKSATGSKIKVIGHANKVFWQDKIKGDREQEMTLIPLSEARAKAVTEALVNLGVDAGLFEVAGVGADGNVEPFGDLLNNWKNRRVEFQIEK